MIPKTFLRAMTSSQSSLFISSLQNSFSRSIDSRVNLLTSSSFSSNCRPNWKAFCVNEVGVIRMATCCPFFADCTDSRSNSIDPMRPRTRNCNVQANYQSQDTRLETTDTYVFAWHTYRSAKLELAFKHCDPNNNGGFAVDHKLRHYL